MTTATAEKVRPGQVEAGMILVLSDGREGIAWKIKRASVLAIFGEEGNTTQAEEVKYGEVVELRKGGRSGSAAVSRAFKREHAEEAARPPAPRTRRSRKAPTPRRAPTKGRQVSATGFAMPKNGYQGGKHAERNAEIASAMQGLEGDARAEKRAELAAKFKILPATVDYIFRYYRPVEEPAS